MSDRQRLREFLTSVDGGDVVALPPSGAIYDQGEGHDEAVRVARARGIAQPVWLFWHQQAAASFDVEGNLAEPLRINWGGDHARVAAVLATLPAAYRVIDRGPNGVFEIERADAANRLAEPYPDPGDIRAAKARLQRITAYKYEQSEADWAWMNRLMVEGDVVVQGAVVRFLAGSPYLSQQAFDTLMAAWVPIYVKSPKDVLITDLLITLQARGDERLETVMTTAAKRKRWTFYYGVSYFLESTGDDSHEELLYTLAQRPGEYVHTPGDSSALDGWVALRARTSGRPIHEVALAAVADPVFDAPARRHLVEVAARDLDGPADLVMVGLLEDPRTAPEVRETLTSLFADRRWARVPDQIRTEVARRLLALATTGSVTYGATHDKVVAGLEQMARGGPPPSRW